jgi:hypothetical protein
LAWLSICYEGVEDEVQARLFIGYHRLKDYDPQRATWYAQCKKTYPTQAGLSTIDCIYDERSRISVAG